MRFRGKTHQFPVFLIQDVGHHLRSVHALSQEGDGFLGCEV